MKGKIVIGIAVLLVATVVATTVAQVPPAQDTPEKTAVWLTPLTPDNWVVKEVSVQGERIALAYTLNGQPRTALFTLVNGGLEEVVELAAEVQSGIVLSPYGKDAYLRLGNDAWDNSRWRIASFDQSVDRMVSPRTYSYNDKVVAADWYDPRPGKPNKGSADLAFAEVHWTERTTAVWCDYYDGYDDRWLLGELPFRTKSDGLLGYVYQVDYTGKPFWGAAVINEDGGDEIWAVTPNWVQQLNSGPGRYKRWFFQSRIGTSAALMLVQDYEHQTNELKYLDLLSGETVAMTIPKPMPTKIAGAAYGEYYNTVFFVDGDGRLYAFPFHVVNHRLK